MSGNTTMDAPATKNENTEQQQLSKNQNLNQSVQEAVANSSDPSTWNRASEDQSVSNVATGGKESLFQDQALPAGMGAMSTASGDGTQQGDPMHQYMNDLNSVLNNSSTLLGDIGNLVSNSGANPSADQLQFDSSAMNLAQSVMNLDGQLLNQVGQMPQFNNAGSDAGTSGTTAASGGTAAAGSDAGAGGTTAASGGTAAAGSDAGAGGTTAASGGTAAAGSDAGAGGTTAASGGTAAAGSDAGTGGTTAASGGTAAAGSDSGAGGTAAASGGTAGAGSDAGAGGTTGAPGSDSGAGGTTTMGGAGSDSGGGIVTGTGDGTGGINALPNTTDLQTLANAMTSNAMASPEWGGNPITLAPGDVTPNSGGSLTDASGNVFAMTPEPGWPAGQITENGVPVADGDYTAAMRTVNGNLYAEDAKGSGWYEFNGSNFSKVGGDPGVSNVSGGDSGAATNQGTTIAGDSGAAANQGTTIAGDSGAAANQGTTIAGDSGTAASQGSATTGDSGTATAPQTSDAAPATGDAPVAGSGTDGEGGIVTGTADGSQPLTDLPTNSDLQTLANTMESNAMTSSEFALPGHGTNITLAPGDITPVSGGSVTDANGNVYALSPTPGFPSGDLTENGQPVQYGTYSDALRIVNGNLWIEDAKTMGWRSYDGNGGWSAFQGDPGVSD